MTDSAYTDLTINDCTDEIMDTTLYGDPLDPENPADIEKAIELGLSLDDKLYFLEGLAARLTELGTPCSIDETDTMLTAVKTRYKDILGKSCPRTVVEWIRGTTPGITNRQNNYDLCYALEMDLKETSSFFQKHYLTIPFILRSGVDAVFYYCLLNSKPYSTVVELLDRSADFVPQETVNTSTAQIRTAIRDIKSDEEFLTYLSTHYYTQQQHFRHAKSIIMEEIDALKQKLLDKSEMQKNIMDEEAEPKASINRLNSETLFALLGYKYTGKNETLIKLPKRFTESLPNDVTLGKIINDEEVSYELLRKTLMLLKFNSFYSLADEAGAQDNILGNLLDFKEELNITLDACGFSYVYMRHPFDCLLMYCANSPNPIGMLHSVLEEARN